MTRADFCRYCRAIYGHGWQTELAKYLLSPRTRKPVNLRTVQRWASGQTPIPDAVWRELPRLGIDRSVEIAATAVRLGKQL